MKKKRNYILFYLNGERQEISGDQAGLMLADFLRYKKSLTGTKIVCAEGDCGACTVLRYFPYSAQKSKKQFLPINSCIAMLAQLDGSVLVTVDALGTPDKPTPVQTAMTSCHGSQCGFCTPGFVMALTGLVEKKIEASKLTISAQEAKNALTGNLCRCTGYKPIIEAAESINPAQCMSLRKKYLSTQVLKDLSSSIAIPLQISAPQFKFYAPTSLKEAKVYLSKNKNSQILGSATDLGVMHNKRKTRLQNLVSFHLVQEFYQLKKSAGKISVGARVSLSDLRLALKTVIPEFANFLDLFASPQIKNIATLVGNVANASPIADTPPILMALNCIIEIHSLKGKKLLPLENFFLGYREINLAKGEFISALHFDIPKKNETLAAYKVSQRKDLDISAVNFAGRLIWSKSNRNTIKNAVLSVGGVAATTLRLKQTEKLLAGKPLSPQLIATAIEILHSEIKPLADLRGSEAFRRIAIENLFNKFMRENLS